MSDSSQEKAPLTHTFFQRAALRFAPGADQRTNDEARARVGALEGWLSLVVNIVLAAIKGVLAWISGSVSLLADAFHTLADSLTSLVVIVGFRLARKPADADHPFGHGRIESVASLIIGVLLGVAALELAHGAIVRLLAPSPIHGENWLLVVVAATALIKELLARFSFELGQLIQSDALEADGWHHRSDVFATLLVVGAFVAARFGLNWIDGIVGVLVSLLIGWTAIQIVVRAANPLIGEAPSAEELRQIAQLGRSVDGALDVHEVVMQRYGSRAVLSLHVQVARELTIVEGHAVGERVEERLSNELDAHVTVHIDPVGASHPSTPAVREILRTAVATLDGCTGFHDLSLAEDAMDTLVIGFDVSTSVDLEQSQRERYRQSLIAAVSERFPGAALRIQFDPPFCAEVPAPSEAEHPE